MGAMIQTVVYYLDGEAFGGAEKALLILLGALDRRRWRPVLFHHPEPSLAPLLAGARQLGVATRALPRMRGRRTLPRTAQFARALRAERPAVFHAHLNWPLSCKFGLIAAALARTPAVVATEQLYVQIRRWRGIQFQRLISTGVDRYIAVSDEVARGLASNFGFPRAKIAVVRNAVPLEGFDRPAPPGLRAALDGGGRPLVLTPARLHEQKGLDVLLDAATRVPDATFVLAGDGPLRDVLQTRARTLGIADRVRFLGARDDVPALLAASDLFVLPSLFEGLPLSVLEAMAARTPVIATRIGGTDEAVVDGETGLLVPPRDPEALAAAIRRLLGDPALARRLAAAGHARVHREFSVATMTAQTEAVYDAILDARRSRAG
ncbi:hypothetical protein tb265_16230 [Gemmatimonadetes bacterium T265]|nr:hypothetical protein tb265_16230 [Gemmatimonadetes bacterium T265]